MIRNPEFDVVREKGFSFGCAMDWLPASDPAAVRQLAQDAALITTPNTTVPAEFLAYVDPKVIEILTGVRNVKKIFSEVRKGDWTVPYAKFRVQEFTGVSTAYDDYADGAVAGVNVNWPSREQYVFQTTIKYGDLETEMASVAKLNLASEKQRAAARVLDVDANRFYLFGVAGKEIYGLLNDPNLPASITPGTAAGGGTVWSGKTADEIYADVLKLASALRQNSMGNINEDTPLVLALSPSSNSLLAKINTYGLSVREMLKNEFGNKLSFVELPELYNAVSGSTVMLIATEIMGAPTAELAFGEKYHAHRIVEDMSSIKQKISASTYGCVLYYPMGVAVMEAV